MSIIYILLDINTSACTRLIYFHIAIWYCLHFFYLSLRILEKLKHPHIVSYHESFFDDDEYFLYIVQVCSISYVCTSIFCLLFICFNKFDIIMLKKKREKKIGKRQLHAFSLFLFLFLLLKSKENGFFALIRMNEKVVNWVHIWLYMYSINVSPNSCLRIFFFRIFVMEVI